MLAPGFCVHWFIRQHKLLPSHDFHLHKGAKDNQSDMGKDLRSVVTKNAYSHNKIVSILAVGLLLSPRTVCFDSQCPILSSWPYLYYKQSLDVDPYLLTS